MHSKILYSSLSVRNVTSVEMSRRGRDSPLGDTVFQHILSVPRALSVVGKWGKQLIRGISTICLICKDFCASFS